VVNLFNADFNGDDEQADTVDIDGEGDVTDGAVFDIGTMNWYGTKSSVVEAKDCELSLLLLLLLLLNDLSLMLDSISNILNPFLAGDDNRLVRSEPSSFIIMNKESLSGMIMITNTTQLKDIYSDITTITNQSYNMHYNTSQELLYQSSIITLQQYH